MPSKKEIQKLLYHELEPQLVEMGFKGKKSDGAFSLEKGDWNIEIVTRIMMGECPRADFFLVATYLPVEKLLFEAMPFRDQKQGYEYTLAFSHEDFFSNPDEKDDYLIEADDYFGIVADSFVELYKERIMPELDNLDTIQKFDSAINRIPFQPFRLIAIDLNQAIRGLIVRRLANQEELEEVFEMYQPIIKKHGRGNVKAFNNLFSYLKEN